MRIPILVLAVVWLLTSVVRPAGAACTPPDLEFALREAPTVFVAEATEVDAEGSAAELRVIAVWKGTDLPERVEADGRPGVGGAGAPARRYTEGATYLVIPHSQLMPFPDDGCTATRLFAAQGTLIPSVYQDAVGAERGRPPVLAQAAPADAGTSATIGSAPFIGGAAALLLLAVAVVWLRNTREPAAANGSRRRFAGAIGGATRRSGMRSVKRLRNPRSR